jgi:hypothetical protein
MCRTCSLRASDRRAKGTSPAHNATSARACQLAASAWVLPCASLRASDWASNAALDV